MKKSITSLALFICVLVPITQVKADSIYTGQTQDQVEGVSFDPNTESGIQVNTTTSSESNSIVNSSSSTFQLNMQFVDLAKTIIENKVATASNVKDFDEAFNIHYKAFSRTINNPKSTITQIKSATAGLRGMSAVKLFVKGVSAAGTALSVLDYKDAADSFFSEAAEGHISPEATSNLLEKAISFHPVGAGLASIKNSTLDSMRELNNINSTFAAAVRNEATMFSNEVTSFTENAIIEEGINVSIYEETKTQHIIRLVQIKKDIAQTPMWPGDRKKLGDTIDKLLEVMGGVNFQDRLSNIQTVQNDIIYNTIGPQRAIIVPGNPNDDESVYASGDEEDSEEVESHTLVNPNVKPTQAELDAKAKEQLLITSQLNSSNRSVNALNSQLQSTENELRELESQEHGIAQQQNSISASEIADAERKLNFFFQAYVVSKKYNGDLSNISGKDLVKLKILSKNTFGTAREWKTLFRDSRSLFNNQKHTYESLKREYEQQIQSQQASARNSNRIALLRKRIAQLEQAIIPKRQENTDYQIQKHDLDFITMNLTDAANDDSKVVLAAEQDPNSDSTPEFHWWSGNFTQVYYTENMGVPEFGGYGDAEAETKTIKPGNGSTLYLHDFNGDTQTRTLTESEAAYFGNYTYTAWGTWSDPNAVPTKIYTSHWVVTDETADIEMPKQGTATYNGELAGGQFTIGQAGYNSVNGNITFNADFSSKTISGNLTVKNASNGATWGTASISNGSIENSEFNGQLTGAGVSNAADWHSHINGSFGGNSAAEAGGVWAITKGTGNFGDEMAVGVFRAKKQ